MSVTLGDMREVQNVAEIASYLGVSQSIVRRLIREKKVPYSKIEGCYRFYLPEVRAWLSKITTPPGNETPQDISKRSDEIWNSGR